VKMAKTVPSTCLGVTFAKSTMRGRSTNDMISASSKNAWSP
jgi:hypothetical protein